MSDRLLYSVGGMSFILTTSGHALAAVTGAGALHCTMEPLAERIAMAERHVRDGRAVLDRQRDLIERHRAHGYNTDRHEDLLRCFERSQATFESDLVRLQRERV